jgi:hypothetical protein
MRGYRRPGASSTGDSQNATLRFGMNLDLASRGLTIGTPSEPSVAASGNIIFYTANFSAGYSLDGGISWSTITPGSDLPSIYGGFCCDQVVMFVPQVNRFVWLLQYWPDANRNAAIRMVIVSPAQLRAGTPRNWPRWDFDSNFLGQPRLGLDQPDLAVGTHFLYMTVDQMTAGGQVSQSHVVRIGLGQLLRKDAMDVSTFTNDQAYLHPVQHIQTRAYFVQHRGTKTIRVYYWDENSNQIAWRDIEHASVADANWTSLTPAPGNQDWLARTNSSGGYRIRGATLAHRVLWLAWSAGRDATISKTESKALFKQPHIEIARVGAGTLRLLGEDTVSNDNHAFARPALDTTASGDVVMSFAWGGGGKWYPSQGAAFLTGRREFWSSLQNDADAVNGATNPHGDYATIRAGWPSSECAVTIAVGWRSGQGVARLVTFGRADNQAECTPRPEFLEPSALELACPSGVITTATSVSLSGKTVPARPGLVLRVTWQGPGSLTVTHTVVTDQTGGFTDPAPSRQAGTWRVIAVAPGDSRYLSAQSSCSYSVSEPPPGKLPSALTLACPPGPPNFTLQYTTLTLAGRIDPTQAAAPVTVTYSLPGGVPAVHTVATDASGNFSDRFSFDVPGNWSIQANWAGSGTYAGASSGVCPLEVAYRPR